MSEHAKSARAAMKAKAKRMGDAGDPKAHVDASSWTPPEMVNSGAKTGMRPVSKRAFKRGGKVLHVEGEQAHQHAGRKPRNAGNKALTPNNYINRDSKEANRERSGGMAHVGGYKHGGAPKHDDIVADRALVRKMVKGAALTGKKHGGEAGAHKAMRKHKADGGEIFDEQNMPMPPARRMPRPQPDMGARYNEDAVNQAIGSSNRSGRKIKKREAEMIHALLRGRAHGGEVSSKRKHREDGGGAGGGDPYEPGDLISGRAMPVPARNTSVTRPSEKPDLEGFYDLQRKAAKRKDGGKADHGAGCRCHKCSGGRMGKAEGGSSEIKSPSMYHVIDRHTGDVVGKFKSGAAASSFRDKKDNAYGASRYTRRPIYEDDVSGRAEGGKIGDIGGERPQHGGRMARATGGRAKGKTNVNIIISTGRPAMDGAAGQSGMPGGMGGPGAAPAVMPRQAPVAAPMPMPQMGGGMPMPPPQMPPPGPMGRKAGGRVYRSYKDMDAGAGSGLGRLEKTEIERRK